MDRIDSPICVSDDTRLRTSDAPTEGTEVDISIHKSTVTLSESQDACDLEDEYQSPFICVPVTQMGTVPAADVPECHKCGLPWTYDICRHRTAVQRGLREFICDGCREAEIAAKCAIGPLAVG